MADQKSKNNNISSWRNGQLHLIDELGSGVPELGSAIAGFGDFSAEQKHSRHWIRAVQWIENILFGIGRHYIDDILVSRITRDSNSDLSVVNDAVRDIPKPVNDYLGRYIETNISLLTENRPVPRVIAKSNRAEDEDAAELSELTLEFLWEALLMPEKLRDLARLLLYCGIGFVETWYDPTEVRILTVPDSEEVPFTTIRGPGGTAQLPIPSSRKKLDETGRPIFTAATEFGEICTKIISPFEMHMPIVHRWEDIPWVMREEYMSIDVFKDKFGSTKRNQNFKKKDGWHLENLDKVGTSNVRNLPLWWWERLADIVEGPGPSLYVGTPETWEGYTIIRWFDRAPSKKWPKGRSILVAGDKVIYDSPKEIGARAYDPRWPKRWHPYTKFVWEPIPGSVYGRSMVSKLLPKIKRINSIDTTLIMWRRTVPIASWIAPKGSHPIEDQWWGKPGGIWEYDPRRTAGKAPEPVFAPEYPRTALEERAQQIADMETIAGTEEILRGERPPGVNSAAMIDILRKQALASRSPALQGWDEGLQLIGSHMLQETIKSVRDDSRYAERLRILANEKKSHLTITKFSGSNLSDNTIVKIDTASMALVSKEARAAKTIEFLQYAGVLMQLPPGLRAAVLERLEFGENLKPSGPDIDRAKRLLSYIRQNDFDRVIPRPEDDPYVFYDLLKEEYQSDAFYNLDPQQQALLLALMDAYKQQVEAREQQQLRLQMAMGGAAPGGEQV